MTNTLQLVLCWHMHQPDYRHFADGEFALPWTYLHAVKDYSDMAAHLEEHRDARAVVNFVPVLLEQLDDYAAQFASGQLKDPLLRLLAKPDLTRLSASDREFIFASCFRNHHPTMIEPFAPYKRLHTLYLDLREHDADALGYLSEQYLADLLVWYHLSWTGESVRRSSPQIAVLMAKGSNFSADDRRQLFNVYGTVISGLIDRYQKLAETGRVEISTTPNTHPIVPLLLDFQAAREAEPGAELPVTRSYPGGEKRAEFHIASALADYQQRFGYAAAGMWPAEGGVSSETLTRIAAHGCAWSASGEGVLMNSLRHYRPGIEIDRQRDLYRPYRVGSDGQTINCFFRDDRLSDLIGFEYAKWHGEDAVRHLIGELERIRNALTPGQNGVVSIIMDGENAWECYPYNGYYFLDSLYRNLADHPFINMTTFAELVKSLPSEAYGELPGVVAGSWVYGTFSTWIGSPDKNRAWDLLCAAKQSFDLAIASGRLGAEQQNRAYKQLADCESSDWFWWFGDYNSPESVASFDALYRENLAHLYRLLALPVPHALAQPLSVGGGQPALGGTMRRAS